MADLSQARTRVGIGGASLRVTSAAQFAGKALNVGGGLAAMLGRYERKRKRRPRMRPH